MISLNDDNVSGNYHGGQGLDDIVLQKVTHVIWSFSVFCENYLKFWIKNILNYDFIQGETGNGYNDIDVTFNGSAWGCPLLER